MKMRDSTKNKTPKVDNQCVQSAAEPTLCRVTFRKHIFSNSTVRTLLSFVVVTYRLDPSIFKNWSLTLEF